MRPKSTAFWLESSAFGIKNFAVSKKNFAVSKKGVDFRRLFCESRLQARILLIFGNQREVVGVAPLGAAGTAAAGAAACATGNRFFVNPDGAGHGAAVVAHGHQTDAAAAALRVAATPRVAAAPGIAAGPACLSINPGQAGIGQRARVNPGHCIGPGRAQHDRRTG